MRRRRKVSVKSRTPRHRISRGPWSALEKKLEESLKALEAKQYLIISEKYGWGYVQFAAQGSNGLRAECVSNNYLDAAHALDPVKIAALRKFGWLAPTGTPDEILAKRQGGGSPNFYRDFEPPVPFRNVASMAVRTIAEVLEVPHPDRLQYKAFERDQGSILIPALGLSREPRRPPRLKPRPDSVEQVRKLVLEAIRRASGDQELEFDKDGDLSLRFGSALVIVRVLDDSAGIRVYSPILANVEVNDLLVDRLNELNAKVRFARLFASDETVYAAVELFASPFVAEHVTNACWLLGNLADDIDEILQREFGGRTAFGEFRDKYEVH